jgi:hypothetical protein
MKKEQIKFIGAGTYNKKELHTFTVEEFKTMVGEELANNWLTSKCRTKEQTSKLSMKELSSSMFLDMEVEEILREKLNYKSKQMLFYFGGN